MASDPLWTDTELAIAVDAYVFLLGVQRSSLRMTAQSTAEVLLAGPLSTRNDASLRYRMRNISAVVAELGGPILLAYSPAERVGANVRARIRAMLVSHSGFQRERAEYNAKTVAKTGAASRDAVLRLLANLREQIEKAEHEIAGVGHNRPPEPINPEEWRPDFEGAVTDIRSLEIEIAGGAQNPKTASRLVTRLLQFGLALAVWLGERATKFVDVTLKILAPLVVVKLTGLGPLILDTLKAVSKLIGL